MSRFSLEAYPAIVPRGSRILVVENPRVVEAAAQRRAVTPVVSTNGRPSSTVLLLLTQLREAGAELPYNGDFDAAGLVSCPGNPLAFERRGAPAAALLLP